MTKKKIRIAQFAPIAERVPPKMYGGTERVVHYLTEGLVKKGHDVTLFATGNSQTNARLMWLTERGTRLDKNLRDPSTITMLSLGTLFEKMIDEFDIIHCHVDYLAYPYASLCNKPVVFTTHGRLDLLEYSKIMQFYKDLNYVSISNAQRKPVKNINWCKTVYHGYPKNLYTYSESSKDYFLYLGRIAAEKCPDDAINFAKKAGVRLKIAAKIDPTDKLYFKEKIEPLLDHPLIEFLGEVNDTQKNELLGGAKALLNTINWPEPFGLVMIEALACGTPVISRPCGSVPEIITNNETGFLCLSDNDFINAINNIEQISRKRCREEFEKRFTVDSMVEGYEDLYYKLLEKQ
jgi:glycosyltransferase involved in cell wall biosynthesis